MKRMAITLLDQSTSLNAVFGDPLPGTSKRLTVHYVISEVSSGTKLERAATAEAHTASFAEHEAVVLRRRVQRYLQDERSLLVQRTPTVDAQETSVETKSILNASNGSRNEADSCNLCSSTSFSPAGGTSTFKQSQQQSAVSPLPSSVSEIVLPIVMPFLDTKERVRCQLVSKTWRAVILYRGIAATIDSSAFPTFSRSIFRGFLSHSYLSLQKLFLSGFEDLAKSDLHPAIPHLRQLQTLDVSYCKQLDDDTMTLLSQHIHETLQVLYIKSLQQVTDEGLKAICCCSELVTLDISNLPRITDMGGVAIGENLTRLRCLYLRDNFRLTNVSIDMITRRCTRLQQLTLWGSIKLQQLVFADSNFKSELVSLNLWGCHGLRDDSAWALEGMSNLQSLVVSECHRLTDEFVVCGLPDDKASCLPTYLSHHSSCITDDLILHRLRLLD
jgi:hypothetical protein